jgi:hypothetical protein
LLKNSEAFRKRKEIADTIEMTKTESERQGAEFWNKNLRNYSTTRHVNRGSDDSANRDNSRNNNTGVEVIRLTDRSFNSIKNSSPRIKNMERERSFNEFFSKNKHDISKINVDIDDKRDLNFVVLTILIHLFFLEY